MNAQTDARSSLELLKRSLEDDPQVFQKALTRFIEAILVMDCNGLVQYANLAASALLGLPIEHLVGLSFGIPIVTLEKAELDIMHPGGKLRVAEMWLSQLERGGETFYLVALHDITERKQAEATLRESEERYRIISEMLSDFAYVCRIEQDGQVIVEWTMGALAQTLGLEIGANLSFQEWLSLVHPESRDQLLQMRERLMAGKVTEDEIRISPKGRPASWFHHRGRPVWDSQLNRTLRIYGTVEDITKRKEIEEALQKTNTTLSFWVNELKRRNQEVTLLNEMAELLQSCIHIEEAYRVVANFSQKLFPMQGGALYDFNADSEIARTVATWGDYSPSSEEFLPENCWAYRRGQVHLVTNPQSDLLCLHVQTVTPIQPYICIPLNAQGETLGVLHLHGDLSQTNPEQWELLAITMSERVAIALANLKLRETLHTQAIRDSLTGLFNRRYLEQALDKEIRRSARLQRPMGLILLDVDHFKSYNDRFGHDTGDHILRVLATFLRSQVREQDFTCRLGGDEFVVVLPESHLQATFHRAEQISQEIKNLELRHNGLLLNTLSISAGIANYPQHGQTPVMLIKAADEALFQAKNAGRDGVRIYQPGEGL